MTSDGSTNLKAVLWDFGGVISTSPFDWFASYERENGLPTGFIRQLNATNPHDNAWARLERGQLDLNGFAERFEAEAAALGHTIDALAILGALKGEIRPEMVEAIRRCHERMKTGLLTNNFISTEQTFENQPVLQLFEVVLESSKTGLRKPDPAFYLMACELLAVEPSQAVFLDDLGVNLKPARALGMHTIKVSDPFAALAELEAIVGFSLRS